MMNEEADMWWLLLASMPFFSLISSLGIHRSSFIIHSSTRHLALLLLLQKRPTRPRLCG